MPKAKIPCTNKVKQLKEPVKQLQKMTQSDPVTTCPLCKRVKLTHQHFFKKRCQLCGKYGCIYCTTMNRFGLRNEHYDTITLCENCASDVRKDTKRQRIIGKRDAIQDRINKKMDIIDAAYDKEYNQLETEEKQLNKSFRRQFEDL